MLWFLGFTPPPIGFFRFSMQTNNETVWWDGLMLEKYHLPNLHTPAHMHSAL